MRMMVVVPMALALAGFLVPALAGGPPSNDHWPNHGLPGLGSITLPDGVYQAHREWPDPPQPIPGLLEVTGTGLTIDWTGSGTWTFHEQEALQAPLVGIIRRHYALGLNQRMYVFRDEDGVYWYAKYANDGTGNWSKTSHGRLVRQ